MRIVAALTVFLFVQCAPSPERREESAPPRASTASPPTAMSPAPAGAEAAVRGVIEQFGQRLRNVSLLGPRHVLEASIRREYGPYATDALLAAWLKDPSKAPGRLTSSPWPERIEIREIRRAAPDRYVVSGEIVESSSGGEAPRRLPARIELIPMGGRWWIDAFTSDDPER